MKSVIELIRAREILSGPGRPTVEVELTTADGIRVEASVPSGTSKGKYEAWEEGCGKCESGDRSQTNWRECTCAEKN